VGAQWQWEIDHPLDTSNATDMGTNDVLPDGGTAPKPSIYDIDGILNPASTVNTLHSLGDKAICYVEVGTARNYYSAVDEGLSTTYYAQFQAAGVLGSKLSGYPENFLNINSPATVSIVESMILEQCANKGFDGVETDLDETFNGNEGTTGFTITQADEQAYLTTLANYMHGLGLGWIGKNPDDTGVQSFVNFVAGLADGVITEQCNQYTTCSAYASAGMEHVKWIGNAEYSLTPSQFCTSDDAAGISGAAFPTALSGQRSPCD